MPPRKATHRNWADAALDEAQALGLLGDSSSVAISARVSRRLLDAAKERAGVRSSQKLLLIALSVLATRDDFGEQLLKRQGSIDPFLDLEF